MDAPTQRAAQGATRDSLRRHNLSVALRRVHRDGAQSRSALTTATGLNRSTVGALVAELVDYGLVREGKPPATGEAGRPSPLVLPSGDHVVVAAVDIATRWTTVGIASLGGRLLHRFHADVDNDQVAYPDSLARLCELLDQALGALGPGQQLYGVGVAAPGVVRASDGFVHLAPNLSWRDIPLGADLEAHLAQARGRPTAVAVANEAHLGAKAEHLRGAGVGVEDMLYLSSEIGVGGGAIIGGRLHLGADGYSGEVGHVGVATGPEATRCRCGSVGCLEAETGELALLALLGRGDTTSLSAAVRDIIEQAREGDAEVLGALHVIGQRLGRGLAGLVNVLNPRRVVLGGYFGDALEFLEAGIGRALEAHALGPNLAEVTVVPGALRESSTLIGAAELALEPLLADPASSPVRLG